LTSLVPHTNFIFQIFKTKKLIIMKRIFKISIGAAIIAMSIVSCSKKDAGGGSSSLPTIETSAIAQQLANTVRVCLTSSVDDPLPNGFVAPKTISSATSGNVTITGTKVSTSTGTSASGSGFDTKTTDINLDFSNFDYDSVLTLISGSGTYRYDYSYDYREWGAVSSTKVGIWYTLTSCQFTFTFGGKKYGGTVTINYSSPQPYATGYTATVSFEGGQTFQISGRV
jgi:hypothetical protein